MRTLRIFLALLPPLLLAGCIGGSGSNSSGAVNISCGSKNDDLDLQSFSVRGTSAVSVPTQPEVIDSTQGNGAFTINWQATSGYRFRVRQILSRERPPLFSFGRPPGVVLVDRDYGATASNGATVSHSCQLTTDNRICCDGSCAGIGSEVPSRPQQAYITWYGTFNNGDDCQSAVQQSVTVELR